LTERIVELDGAIAKVTFLLSSVEDDDEADEYLGERCAMRIERRRLSVGPRVSRRSTPRGPSAVGSSARRTFFRRASSL
jgi:hypothetical protein